MVKQEHGEALAVRVGDRLVLYNLAWVGQGAGAIDSLDSQAGNHTRDFSHGLQKPWMSIDLSAKGSALLLKHLASIVDFSDS